MGHVEMFTMQQISNNTQHSSEVRLTSILINQLLFIPFFFVAVAIIRAHSLSHPPA